MLIARLALALCLTGAIGIPDFAAEAATRKRTYVKKRSKKNRLQSLRAARERAQP